MNIRNILINLGFLLVFVHLFCVVGQAQTDRDRTCRQLFLAIEKRDVGMVEKLLADGSPVNCQDNSRPGWTLLHEAASGDKSDIVKILLKYQADVSARDWAGMTPLHRAAERGGRETISLLIASGADVNALGLSGSTPLFRAVESDNLEAARLLIQNKALVNLAAGTSRTPLYQAAIRGKTHIVRLLIENGADPAYKENEKKIILHQVIDGYEFFDLKKLNNESDRIEILRLLLPQLESINSIDQDGNTALHLAAKRGNLEIARLLVTAGADVNAVNQNTESGATKERFKEPLKPSEYGEQTPLFIAVLNGEMGVAQYLLENHADPNIANAFGWTSLHAAAAIGQDKITAELIHYAANANLKDSKGWSPLHYAAFNGQTGTTEVLISGGSHINIKTTGNNCLAGISFPAGATPIDVAAVMGSRKVAAILERAGGKKNIVLGERWEPLTETETRIRISDGHSYILGDWLLEETEGVVENKVEGLKSGVGDIEQLTPAESRALSLFIKKETGYEIPSIKAEVISDFIKSHRFFYIREMGGPIENHNRYCLIGMKKGGQSQHRFGHFEAEIFKEKDSVAYKDINYFNRILRENKFKPSSSGEGFKAAVLFTKLVGYYENEPVLAPANNPEWHPPIYRQTKKGYLFQFFTDFDYWRLWVNYKGKIELEFSR